MKSELYNLTEAELELFDKLYDGTIDEDSFYAIKSQLQKDEVLRHKFIVYKLMRKEIEQDGVSSKVLKQHFKELDNKVRWRKRFLFIGSLAITISIILAIIVLQLNNQGNLIYNTYKSAESGLPIRMAENDVDQLEQSMIDMANNDFKQAIEALNQLLPSDTVVYYQAYCNERLEHFDLAQGSYEKLSRSSSDFIKHKAAFRLALLQIKLQDKNALMSMQQIANDSTNDYHRLAHEIVQLMGE